MSSTTDPASTTSYKQGHSASTISTHLRRTATVDAAFLLPHLHPTSHILDIGCGPGTITTSLAPHVPSGSITGLDASLPVLEKARSLLAARDPPLPIAGPGAVKFVHGSVLERLPFEDATFDVVFASQLFGHLQLPTEPVTALKEAWRVLKPGGVLATRDGLVQHFFPARTKLDRLWLSNTRKVYSGGKEEEEDTTVGVMPRLMREAGFNGEGGEGEVKLGVNSLVVQGREKRLWLANRAAGQLSKGDEFRQSWLNAGIGEENVEEAVAAAKAWAETDDAFYLVVQLEMLGWKTK